MSTYVVIVGEKFLGFGGKLVSEYPDAEQFYSRTDAILAARKYNGIVEKC